MKNILLLVVLLPALAFCQFKNDNVSYKTIYWQQFCNQFFTEKDALLLDVRSLGEYADTSEDTEYNIGHLQGSTNINISELGKRLNEINSYKNKPIYLYCSHSQRSRRGSKLLSDSGFNNVININGGLTDLYLTDLAIVPCRQNLLVTNNAWKQYSPQQVTDLLHSKTAITIVDVRTDSAFNGISIVEKDKALGRLKGSINIPLNQLESSLDKIPKTKPVLLVDNYGNESLKAAAMLTQKGYSNIITCFNGLDAWLQSNDKIKRSSADLIERKIRYDLLDAYAFHSMAVAENATILDIRKAEEYNNQSQVSWRNRGRIKGSTNIPLEKLATGYTTIDNSKPVILTGFGNNPEVYEAAEFLTIKGFKYVYVLTTGIWGLRYQAFNAPNSMYLNDWVVDVPEENK